MALQASISDLRRFVLLHHNDKKLVEEIAIRKQLANVRNELVQEHASDARGPPSTDGWLC